MLSLRRVRFAVRRCMQCNHSNLDGAILGHTKHTHTHTQVGLTASCCSSIAVSRLSERTISGRRAKRSFFEPVAAVQLYFSVCVSVREGECVYVFQCVSVSQFQRITFRSNFKRHLSSKKNNSAGLLWLFITVRVCLCLCVLYEWVRLVIWFPNQRRTFSRAFGTWYYLPPKATPRPRVSINRRSIPGKGWSCQLACSFWG